MNGMATIEPLDAAGLAAAREALIDLLIDVVEHGASVGFVLPLSRSIAGAYWDDVADAMRAGSRRLWVAHRGGRIVGTVQLGAPTRSTARPCFRGTLVRTTA